MGTRGFRRPGDYDTRILLLLDGHRINNIGDGPAFGAEFLLDVDLIERVEIIRGPGSTLYGGNALLVFQNLGEVEATDAEPALSGRWDCGLQSRVSYSYTEVEDGETGETLVDTIEQDGRTFRIGLKRIRNNPCAVGDLSS